MRWKQDQKLVRSLAHHAVSRVAPGELALFDVTCDAYFESPRRAHRPSKQRDPLGFGIETVVTVVSPIALTISVEVLKHLAERYAEKSTRRLARLWRRWRGKPVDPLPALSAENLAEVRELARNRARVLGLSDDQADLLADSVTAELAAKAGD